MKPDHRTPSEETIAAKMPAAIAEQIKRAAREDDRTVSAWLRRHFATCSRRPRSTKASSGSRMSEAARLLDVHATAAYLGGICADSVRALVAAGMLVPVRLPSTRRPGESSRRLLFDVRDLDALIDQWKRASSAAPNAGLSAAAVKGWQSSPVRKRGAA